MERLGLDAWKDYLDELLSDAFFVDSCLRQIWVTQTHQISCGSRENLEEVAATSDDIQVFEGLSAYRFLLEVSSGLKSAILGETDIFGQFKHSWIDFEKRFGETSLCQELRSPIQKVFADTKEIRSKYLQGVGGSSYGTLVRRLVDPKPDENVFFVGAGQLAQSILPYFNEVPILLWNRNKERRDQVISNFRQQEKLNLQPIEDEMAGWDHARHVILCLPPEPRRDRVRLDYLRRNQKKVVVHLGARRYQTQSWRNLSGFYDLDHVFELEKTQGHIRSIQIAQAQKACEERAMLRSLDGSVSTPHGWEDLAVFN